MYSSTSSGTATLLPVVPVMVTAYTNPWLASHSIRIRAGGVTGVTICTSATPTRSKAARISALSSYGRSGMMNPATPASTAASGSLSRP